LPRTAQREEKEKRRKRYERQKKKLPKMDPLVTHPPHPLSQVLTPADLTIPPKMITLLCTKESKPPAPRSKNSFHHCPMMIGGEPLMICLMKRIFNTFYSSYVEQNKGFVPP